jgi:hypothetical protein
LELRSRDVRGCGANLMVMSFIAGAVNGKAIPLLALTGP